MFKKLLVVAFAVLFLVSAGNVMANGVEKDGEGFYKHTQTGNVKYFNSHPVEPSQWVLCDDGQCGDLPEPNPNQATANTFNYAKAVDHDFDLSFTGWKGNWNDFSMAGAKGYVEGMTENFAGSEGYHAELELVYGPYQICWGNGCWEKEGWHLELKEEPNPADAEGKVIVHSPEVKAWAWSKDYGLTSKAGAGAKVEGSVCDVFVYGKAKGIDGQTELSYSAVAIGGEAFQFNKAGETGYYAGFATGQNKSGFSFYAEDNVSDEGQTYSFLGLPIGGASTSLHGIDGYAITKGMTEVSIDPYGNFRSAYATTSNFSNINFQADAVYGSVYGFGGVESAISNGPSYATGSAGFGYSGSFSGSGNATVFNSVIVNPGGMTAISMGSAHSVAD